MHKGVKGKRKTGNKTVTKPTMPINEEVAKGGVDLKKGYKTLSKPKVLSSPKK